MNEAFIEALPRDLVTHVTAICGRGGEEWFKRLPELIAQLEGQWSISVGEPFPGIEFNYVARALMAERPVVVKLAPPYEPTEIFAEAKYLKTRDGDGAVRLLAVDRDRHAILLEQAEPGYALFETFENDPAGAVAPAVKVLKTILRPRPADMTDVQSLDVWFNNFRRSSNTDFPQTYARKALAIYESLSRRRGTIFYLHGDFHPGNIVSSGRAPFLAIDPKGLVGHIGYDLAVFLNNLRWWRKNDPNLGGLLNFAVEEFAANFEMTEREVREWAFASMVIGAWWSFEDMPEHYDTNFAEMDIWDV